MAFEFQDDALAGGGARQAEGGLGHFRSGRSETDALGRGDAFAENPGGFELDLRLAGIKNALVDLVLDRLLHTGGRVAQHHGAHAAIIIDQAVAIGVDQIGTLAALEHQRPARHADAEIAVDPSGNMLGALRNQLRRTRERHVSI